MPKLNQILAIEKGKRTQLHQEITQLYHATQKQALMNGQHRKFEPRDEDGETFPEETAKVQLRYQDAIDAVIEKMSVLMDVTATKDYSNCTAKADIVVGGEVFMEGVPVPYLLFMEKELQDLHSFVSKMTDLDSSENWTLDPNSDLHRSEPIRTHKTKKLQKAIVLYDATEHHPAQTQMITEDVVIGHWLTTKFSGAIPYPKKKRCLERINILQDAVKFAREQANSMEADEQKVGKKVLDFIFQVS